MFIAAAIVRWREGQDYGLETLVMERRKQSQLETYIIRLVQAETHGETLHQVWTTV